MISKKKFQKASNTVMKYLEQEKKASTTREYSGQELKARRKELGYTLAEVEEKCGIGSSNISRYENDITDMSYKAMVVLLKFYKL